MEISENKLINNAFMFIYARQNKPPAEKILNIEKTLYEGADINSTDANNKNNTILHIVTRNDEKDVVQFLLTRNALLLYNLDNKTPVHIAREKNTAASKEILKLLTDYGKCQPRIESSRVHQTESRQSCIPPQSNCSQITKEFLYPKRAGTSGVSGQFYETKLLSLVCHRALHDTEIEEFYLAANIRDIGDFDDVCFRFNMQENGNTKPVVCFIQAKHREDTDKAKLTVASIISTSGQFCLTKYFDSFLRIKQKFLTNTKSHDPMFKGKYNDIDCYFILYTPLKESFHKKLTGSKRVNQKLHDFIYTGDKEEVFQFNYDINEINFLTQFMQKERIKVLGKVLLNFILSNKTKDIMTNDLIQIYHPALAQKVICLSKIKDHNYLEGKFRDDFLDTDNDLLKTLKETLYKEIVFTKNKKSALSKDEVKDRIEKLINYPSPATISPIIGQAIYFDDKTNKLCFETDKKYKQEEIREINHHLQKVQVTLAMVNDAIKITGKNKLKSLTFHLPYTFGNLDFPSNLKNYQVPEDRLKFLANKFYQLINERKLFLEEEQIKNHEKNTSCPIEVLISNHNVGPQKILEVSHLNTKGIGGTVGNLLQFNDDNQTFKFNTNEESLGPNAKYMLGEIKKLIEDDLTQYRFQVKMNNFPRTSFNPNQNDKAHAEEFLSKLWFYTNQAKEEMVESILKNEIDYYYNANKNQNQFLFRVHSDAIFLRFHDEMQKWWKSQSQARYLTKSDTIFDDAKKDIIDSPVLTVLNVMFIRTLKKFNIEFKADVVSSINLDKMIENKKILNILTDAVILSATKIMQVIQFQTKYTFINLDYVHILPQNDYSKMMNELGELNSVTLIIVCETSIDERLQNTLSKMITIYKGKIIIITDKLIDQNTYQNNECVFFKDENISLNYLKSESESKILKESVINYQGKDVTLSTIIDENSKYLVDAKFLHSILYKNKIKVGQALDSEKYNQIKKYYHRSLFRDEEEYKVKTFNDINDKIVLITSLPSMGKGTLLTHLSLETKKVDPQPWIVRINMSSALSNDLAKWPNKNVHVTHIIRFLCKAALRKTDQIDELKFTEVTTETISIESDSPQNLSFELQWFIHCYNKGKIIILFDGFDKIFPHHTKQGIQLLMALKRSNKRIWITSSSYVGILEQELGTPYTIDKLSTESQESTLNKFLITNRKIEKLNHQQYHNLSIFFKYLLDRFHVSNGNEFDDERPFLPILSSILHFGYLVASEYFKNEANNLSPGFLRELIKQKWGLNSYTALDRFLRKPERKTHLELAKTPLHMYIASNYFKIRMEDKFDVLPDKVEMLNRISIFLKAIASYGRFLNIKHINQRQENLNITAQIEERQNLYETYKTVALYAISKEKDLSKLLTEAEILAVKSIIERVESGKTNIGHIDCVLDNIPRLYNWIFAEYFFLELPLIIFKQTIHNDKCDWLFKSESLWNVLVNLIIMVSPAEVRNAFNYKIRNYPMLANKDCDKVKFELILKQDQKASTRRECHNTKTSLGVAIQESLVDIISNFLQNIHLNVDTDTLYELMNVLKSSTFWLEAANSCWKELIVSILQNAERRDEIQQNVNSLVCNSGNKTIDNSRLRNQAITKFGEDIQHNLKGYAYETVTEVTGDSTASCSHDKDIDDERNSLKNVNSTEETSLIVASMVRRTEYSKLNNFIDNLYTHSLKDTVYYSESSMGKTNNDVPRNLVNLVGNSEFSKDFQQIIKTDIGQPIKKFTETLASCSSAKRNTDVDNFTENTNLAINDVSHNLVLLVVNSEFGKGLQKKIKSDICEPIRKFSGQLELEACSCNDKGIGDQKTAGNENQNSVKDTSLKLANLVANTEFGKELHQTIQTDICEPINSLAETLRASCSANNDMDCEDSAQSDPIENVSRKLVNMVANSELGKDLQQVVKSNFCEPIMKEVEEVMAVTSNSQNFSTLVETLPYHLPNILNSLFAKKK